MKKTPEQMQQRPAPPGQHRRLYQQIADRIRVLIDAGRYPAGERLPAERDLATQLGVSRPSVREALIALEIEGTVEARAGAGLYVCQNTRRATAVPPALGESPTEVMQARAALEGAVIVLACAQRTARSMASVRSTHQAMCDAVAAGQDPVALDRKFHVAIAAATGNAVLRRLVGQLFDERHGPIASTLQSRSENAQTWADAVREHGEMVQALESRDPLLAQTTMRMHLAASQRRWLESQ